MTAAVRASRGLHVITRYRGPYFRRSFVESLKLPLADQPSSKLTEHELKRDFGIMAEGDASKEFPDVTHKLAAPKKLSAFEKERQAAEAKRLRAQEEDAAALRAFQDSFADEDDDDDLVSSIAAGRGPPAGPRGGGAGYGAQGGRYGAPPPGPRSGPGGMGPAPAPAPLSLKRKRALDEMREAQEARREQGLLAPDHPRGDSRHTPQVSAQEAEQEDDAAKPTVQLSSLPPEFTAKDAEALLKGYVNVHSVQFLPPAGPGSAGKRSLSAIATLDVETKTGQIDSAISALKDKYLGYGFHLSISRHLSSAALHPSMAGLSASASTEPFGAEKPKEPARPSLRNAPPPPDHRGFAPPESYDSPARPTYGSAVQPEALINVRAPFAIETIRAVHIIVEQLLSEPDPMYAMELEAYLMAKPDVQKDERFSFLFDSRSPAGVYYRYLLWGPEEGDDIKEQKRRAKGLDRVYDDTVIEWLPPYEQVPFPDLTSLAQVVTDIDYVSSDEESDDEGGERRFNDAREGEVGVEGNDKKQLSPVKRARLVHLLSRLPTANARLRKGDVARITNFVISHAGQGAEEIVDLVLLNVEKPFPYSLAAKYEESDASQTSEDEYEPGDALPSFNPDSPQPQKEGKRGDDDPSNAKLIALYLISDILSASSTAGARNAWKYRQLFESGFRARKTFEHLGKLDKELAWGRLKAEQWKRKVGVVFGIWEGWSVFSSEVHEELKRSFFEPPLSEAEQVAEKQAQEREERQKAEEKWKGKFKRVEQTGSASRSASPATIATPVDAGKEADGIDGAPMEELDGQPMEEDLDGAPMEDMDGAPMTDDVDGAPMNLDGAADERPAAPAPAKVGFSMSTSTSATAPKSSGPKRRMRAEDMFADSDEE